MATVQQTPTCCFAAITPLISFLRQPPSASENAEAPLRGKSAMTAVAGAMKNLEYLDSQLIASKEPGNDTLITPSTTSPKSIASDQDREEAESAKASPVATEESCVGPNLLTDLPSLVPVALFLSFGDVSRLILARKAVLDSLTAPPPPAGSFKTKKAASDEGRSRMMMPRMREKRRRSGCDSWCRWWR